MSRNRRRDEIEEFLEDIDPRFIPQEFVSAIAITDRYGNTHEITPEELSELWEEGSPEEQGYSNIQLLVNLDLVKDTIIQYTDQILKAARGY